MERTRKRRLVVSSVTYHYDPGRATDEHDYCTHITYGTTYDDGHATNFHVATGYESPTTAISLGADESTGDTSGDTSDVHGIEGGDKENGNLVD